MVTGLNIIGSNKALQDHWIKRFVALVIDWVIVLVIALIIGAIIFAATFGFGGVFFGLFFGLGTLIYAIIAFLYWTVQDGFVGGTIGKKVMGLQVVGTTGPMDFVKALVRNISKVYWLFLLLDWIVGLATEGDPRQKASDRFAGTTVVRTDQHAYMEEQFRQMATPPPHPQAPYVPPGYVPPPQQQWSGQQAPPPGSAPPPAQQPAAPQQAWPGQTPPAGSGWPQHQWDQQGQLVQQPRFCSNCAGPLVARGDGRLTCPRCGAVY